MNSGYNDYDYLLKLLVIGDVGVGKSSLIRRYADNQFDMAYKTQIGVDFKIRTMSLEGKVVKLQIWDQDKPKRYHNGGNEQWRGASGIIITYDTTDLASFNNVTGHLEDVRRYANDNVCLILVGTKSDLRHQQQVTPEMAQTLATEHNMMFVNTSSKDKTGVEDVFFNLAKQIIENEANEPSSSNQSSKKVRFKLQQSQTTRHNYFTPIVWTILFGLFSTVCIFGQLYHEYGVVIRDQSVVGIFVPSSKYDLDTLRLIIRDTDYILLQTSNQFLITSRALVGSTSLSVIDSMRDSLEQIANQYHTSIVFQTVAKAWST